MQEVKACRKGVPHGTLGDPLTDTPPPNAIDCGAGDYKGFIDCYNTLAADCQKYNLGAICYLMNERTCGKSRSISSCLGDLP